MKNILLLFCFCSLSLNSYTQSNKGINFQGIARYSNGFVVADKTINLRLTILNDTTYKKVEYQEIKSVTTNILGLFTVVVGSQEIGKIITSNSFDNINWSNYEKYLMVEVDLTGDFSFITLGMQKINYVPFAFYADKVEAKNVVGILNLAQGGTGFASIKDIKTSWQLDKVNNTLDSEKPASVGVLALLNDKLNKTDTSSLSSRINQKLNNSDTLSLSNRINLKLNKLDTIYLSNRINQIPKIDTSSLSNRINNKISLGSLSITDITQALNYTPIRDDYGSFYDTAKQAASAVSSATAIKFSNEGLVSNISIQPNTSGQLTKITVLHAGVYSVHYAIQIIKPDLGVDEASVWIRRNGSAYINTNTNFTISGSGIKNLLSGNYLVDLGANDYIELYFSVKNIISAATGTTAQASPSRPATPSAYIILNKVN